MTISNSKGETEQIIELIAKIEQVDSVSGLLGACYRRLHFLSREAMANGDSDKQQRAWSMAARLRQVIDVDQKRIGLDTSPDVIPLD